MKIPLSNAQVLKKPITSLLILFLCLGVLTVTLKIHVTDLIATAIEAIHAPAALLFFTPYTTIEMLAVGDTATIDLDINANIPINSLGVSILYPQDTLEVVGFSKEHSFLDLWTQDTTLKEGSGEFTFSGGTTHRGGMVGTSTVLTITVRAKKAGPATITANNVQVLAADGKGTTVDNVSRSLSLNITDPKVATTPRSSGGSGSSISTMRPTPPSSDLNGDGRVSIVDASILMIHIVMTYAPRYDLDSNGTIGLGDVSILLSKM